MLKKLSQILLIIIFLMISFFVYLSVYGINTDKFNGIINEKISEKDSDFDIKLNKIKSLLVSSDNKLVQNLVKIKKRKKYKISKEFKDNYNFKNKIKILYEKINKLQKYK